MYEAHFGLSDRPFGESVSPTRFIALPSRESVQRRLRYGLEHGQGPALLFGAAGTGKTQLAATLARDLGGPAVHLTFPAMPAADFLAYLSDELDAPPAPTTTLGGTIRRLRRHLSAAAIRGERPLLIVDEAHLIEDPTTFETLRLLLNFATEGPPDLSLLLVGGPEVLFHLPTALADRLTARCLLAPFSESETAAYILGRLGAAGASAPLFDSVALTALHRAADGLPRRLNRLADLALLIAYAKSLHRPDADAVAIAVRESSLEPLAA